MYLGAKIRPEYESVILLRCKQILSFKNHYMMVEAQTKIPWQVVACIHSLESDLSFKSHLHNGDPLTSKTINVPSNRPKKGEPPFTWIESATDALGGYPRPLIWDLDLKLYFLESYNGMGYRRLKINSPYLWSMTDQYTKGKFVFDGHFDEMAASKQIGAVALLKGLETLAPKE